MKETTFMRQQVNVKSNFGTNGWRGLSLRSTEEAYWPAGALTEVIPPSMILRSCTFLPLAFLKE